MSKFFDMFRQSPFKPFQEHMAKVMECVALIRPMFEAVGDQDWERLESITKDVFKAEHEADLIKDAIRQTIPKTFYIPVLRGDLLGYLKMQDDMADAVEDLAVLLTLKKLTLPPALVDECLVYVEKVLEVCTKTNLLGEEFRAVVDNGFTSEVAETVLDRVAEVERAEWESDRVQYKLSQSLFALEGEISPVDIMLWSKVFGMLGSLANYAENVADRARRMIASR